MKKLLALLIAVLMVVALVPATVLSAMVPVSDPDQGGAGDPIVPPVSPEDTAPSVDYVVTEDPADDVDERVEEGNEFSFDLEFTEGEDKFEIVNKDDVLVGYFKDLASADAWVRNGDTLRFLADWTISTRYNFGAGRTQFAKVMMAYTIDGNGHNLIYTAAADTAVTYAYALGFNGNDASHDITLTGLRIVSARGCIEATPGSGQGLRLTVDNCELYANDAYYYVNKAFYAENGLTFVGTRGDDAIAGRTVNTFIVLKGENNKIYANKGSVLYACSIVTVYDGVYYSSGTQAFYITGDYAYAHRTQHKIVFYGGTVVNDTLAAVRIRGGAAAYIFGGNFVQTAECSTDHWATAIRCGTADTMNKEGDANHGQANISQVYIMGGNFYTDVTSTAGLATKVPSEGCVQSCVARGLVYVANANFYYSGAKAYGGTANKVIFSASSSKTDVAAAANSSFTVPSIYTASGYDTVTWTKEMTVAFDATKYADTIVDGKIVDTDALHAATGFEAAILDAEGNIIDLVDVDNTAENSIHKGSLDAMVGVTDEKLMYTTNMTPDGGTYMLIADITSPEGNGDASMFDYLGDGHFYVDGNGYTISVSNSAKYINYDAGAADVTFTNITLINPTGRGLQFGQSAFLAMDWTLGEGTTVVSGAGSAVYLCNFSKLTMLEGSTLEALPATEAWNYPIQMQGTASFELRGGTLKAFASNGMTAAGDNAAVHTKGLIFLTENAGTRNINLISGTLAVYGNSISGIVLRNENYDKTSLMNLTIGADVKLYDLVREEYFEMPKASGDAATVTGKDGEAVGYATLEEAIINANEGDTVTLLRDGYVYDGIEIRKDLVIEGNGYTIYDATYRTTTPLIYITGDDVDVEIRELTVITTSTAIYVSPNTFAQRSSTDTALNANDLKNISVLLDNCQVYTGVYGPSAFDAVFSGEYTSDMVIFGATAGALLMHGEGVYVKITGEDSAYMTGHNEAIVNHGGFLDIYDGMVYAHNATQTLWLRGRLAISANAGNQFENATTAIYGGSFIAGPFISMSVARSAQGHTMVIAGGEFLMMEGGSTANRNSLGRQTIRVSESSRSGYLYILGGNFYNASNNNTNIGYGQANVAYVNVAGGNFFTNYYNAEDTNATNVRVENAPVSTYTFTIAGAVNAFGMQIYDAYEVKNVDRQEVPAYAANTKLAYVKNNAFSYLQTVSRNEQWLSANGYLSEGVAYIVTDGNGGNPESFYSFELERAMMYLGNGGTFTLTRDVAPRMPAKSSASGGFDDDYGVSMRCRPGTAKVLINSSAPGSSYYTITLNATDGTIFSARGGYLHFDNIGLVNNTGRVVHTEAPSTTLYFTDGYYYSYDTTSDQGNTDCISTGNAHANVHLIVEGGTFNGNNRAAFAICNDNATVVFGVEGTQQGPTILVNGAQALWIGNTENLHITFYYATFDDIGSAGNCIIIADSAKNLKLDIYDGYFYCNNMNNNQVLSTGDGSTSEINIYGGTFLRGNTGPGTVSYGKLMIFEGDGTVNVYGGNFRTLVGDNTIYTIRKNTFTLNVGAVGSDGPTFQANGGHIFQIDSANTTTANVNIYSGTFKGSNSKTAILMGEDGSDGTTTVTATVHIYGGNFNVSKTILTVGSNDSAYIHGGNFTSAGSNMFVTNTNSKLYIEDGVFNHGTSSCNIYYPGNNSVLTVTGGRFSGYCFVWSNTSASFTVNFGAAGGANEDLYVYCTAALLGTDGAFTGKVYMNVYSGIYEVKTTGNTIYIYGSGCSGVINLYGGDFWEYGGGSRMFRIGGSFTGDVNILGGTYKQDSTSDLLCIVDTSNVNLTLGCEDGTGPAMFSCNQAILEYNTSTTGAAATVKVLGGTYTVTGGSDSAFSFSNMADNSTVEFSKDVTVIVEEAAKGYAVYFAITGGTCTINGGNYYTYCNSDSNITCGNGTLIINAGYFYGVGMCVARAIGGNAGSFNGATFIDPTASLEGGVITTETTATLIVNGGIFYHDQNVARNENATGWYNDAVIRAGGGSGYGTVELNGGTFVANSDIGQFVVNKYHPASTIRINGGIYMASSVQTYYFNTVGELLDTNGNMIGGKDPAVIPVNRKTDMNLSIGGTDYAVYVLGEQENVTYVKVTSAAEIRITTYDIGEEKGYVSGLRFTTTISADAINQFKDTLGFLGSVSGYGTLIVPKDYLADGIALTHAALDAAGLDYLDIAASDSLVTDAEGNVTFTAAIVEILPENYGRDFVAVGYIKGSALFGLGGTSYSYADYDEEGVSLAELATALLENEPIAPNPYSDELRALLQDFAAALPEDDGTNTPNIPDLPDGDDVIDDPFGNDEDNGAGDGDDNGGDSGDDIGDGTGGDSVGE